MENINDLFQNPNELKSKVLKYLEKKYNEQFAAVKAVLGSVFDENIFTVKKEDDYNDKTTFNVCCIKLENGEFKFVDNYMNLKMQQAVERKLNALISQNVSVFQCHFIGWLSSEYGDENAEAKLSDEKLIQMAGKHSGRWHIYAEYEKTAEEFKFIENDIVNQIREMGAYGRYSFYCVETNALLLMDDENFEDYLPCDTEPDGEICKSINNYNIKER